LNVDLRPLPVSGRGQRDVPKHARACAGGYAADHAALSRGVPPFENHDDPGFFSLHPGLKPHELHLQLRKLLVEFLAAHLSGRSRRVGHLVLLLVLCQVSAPQSAALPRRLGRARPVTTLSIGENRTAKMMRSTTPRCEFALRNQPCFRSQRSLVIFRDVASRPNTAEPFRSVTLGREKHRTPGQLLCRDRSSLRPIAS